MHNPCHEIHVLKRTHDLQNVDFNRFRQIENSQYAQTSHSLNTSILLLQLSSFLPGFIWISSQLYSYWKQGSGKPTVKCNNTLKFCTFSSTNYTDFPTYECNIQYSAKLKLLTKDAVQNSMPQLAA